MIRLLVLLLLSPVALACEHVVTCDCGCYVYRCSSTRKDLGVMICRTHERELRKYKPTKNMILRLSMLKPATFTGSTAYVNAYREWKGTMPPSTTEFK